MLISSSSRKNEVHRCPVRRERALRTLSHLSHHPALTALALASDRNCPGRPPPAAIFLDFKLLQVSTSLYLPPRAKTRLNGALYALSVHREVSATSATGQRLPPTRWPATEIAPVDILPPGFLKV